LGGLAVLCSGIVGNPAFADVVISSAATKNMSCVSGVCTPTSPDAVLNVNDLTSMLASGNVTIEGSGEPVDIDVQAPFSWSSANSLTLDSYHSVNVVQPVAVTGTGGLSIGTNDGGSGGWFTFAPNANVEFSNLSSSLVINSASYALVSNIATLGADIAANPSGNFALAGDYNAQPDGTYSAAPVAIDFGGNFQGLGNIVSNLTISSNAKNVQLGLFAQAEAGSTISNVRVSAAKITAKGWPSNAGILIAETTGLLFGDHTSGTISVGTKSFAGGLAADAGTVIASSSSAAVSGKKASVLGGLVEGAVTITDCFATGSITLKSSGDGGGAGGLVGYIENDSINDSYAAGNVQTTGEAGTGGLIASAQGGTSVTSSYSRGRVHSSVQAFTGGFIGYFDPGTDSNSYWDTQTSGRSNAAGNDAVIPGVTGLTTSQFKSGLPAGFDPTIWAENPKINNGLPYLIANPPQ
jgi:hypothetical protein